MRRRGVPCGCTDNGGNGGCCGLKEKLAILWDRTIGSILRINGISPDGDGDFTIEAGDNINLTETGTGNGIRIDTTGGVSYYESGDAYVNVDNNDLEITVNAGVTGGLALQDDLDTVTGAVNSILDGTTTVPKATDATYLGSNSAIVGSDTKPIKIVNGQAVAVTDDLAKNNAVVHNTGTEVIGGQKTFTSAPLRIQSANHFADWSTFYVGNNYMGTDLYTGIDLNNYGGLRLVWDNTTQKISIQAIKVVNGNFSGTEIVNL